MGYSSGERINVPNRCGMGALRVVDVRGEQAEKFFLGSGGLIRLDARCPQDMCPPLWSPFVAKVTRYADGDWSAQALALKRHIHLAVEAMTASWPIHYRLEEVRLPDRPFIAGKCANFSFPTVGPPEEEEGPVGNFTFDHKRYPVVNKIVRRECLERVCACKNAFPAHGVGCPINGFPMCVDPADAGYHLETVKIKPPEDFFVSNTTFYTTDHAFGNSSLLEEWREGRRIAGKMWSGGAKKPPSSNISDTGALNSLKKNKTKRQDDLAVFWPGETRLAFPNLCLCKGGF